MSTLDLRTPATDLMARLLSASETLGSERVLPFWADGGLPTDLTGAAARLRPSRHLLSAFPSHTYHFTVGELAREGLSSYLRRFLPADPHSETPLVVWGLHYEAGASIPELRAGLLKGAIKDEAKGLSVAIYPGYLVADEEGAPWRLVGNCEDLKPFLTPSNGLRLSNQHSAHLQDFNPQANYLASVAAILEGIQAGDFYQVNLARQMKAPLGLQDGFEIYLRLRQTQPTAFGAYWHLDAETLLVSGSPECLLHYEAQSRRASTFPIKGTIARSPDAEHDAQLQHQLQHSLKDQAEHLMIVDLCRNDLGRIAQVGSVSVPQLFAPLPLRTLHHLVSEISATLDPRYDLADLICALFPGGSITGAPKIAAMNAIATHEPFERGLYCGSLGVCLGGQESIWSILIRSATLTPDTLTYCAGGGLVADSQAFDEWQETELKSAAFSRALST